MVRFHGLLEKAFTDKQLIKDYSFYIDTCLTHGEKFTLLIKGDLDDTDGDISHALWKTNKTHQTRG